MPTWHGSVMLTLGRARRKSPSLSRTNRFFETEPGSHCVYDDTEDSDCSRKSWQHCARLCFAITSCSISPGGASRICSARCRRHPAEQMREAPPGLIEQEVIAKQRRAQCCQDLRLQSESSVSS